MIRKESNNNNHHQGCLLLLVVAAVVVVEPDSEVRVSGIEHWGSNDRLEPKIPPEIGIGRTVPACDHPAPAMARKEQRTLRVTTFFTYMAMGAIMSSGLDRSASLSHGH